jgi:response regulator RpfG family c-di-GMP phosphodiesterase
MTHWPTWIAAGALSWLAITSFILVGLRRLRRAPDEPLGDESKASLEEMLALAAESFEASPGLAEQPMRILVVDDDPHMRALLRTSFEVADIEIDEADTARLAGAKIASQHPDVIVLDVAMPGMDGITFCRGLKSDPFTRSIAVVLLTGDGAAESEGRAAGADAFLRKPFSPLELLTVAERLAAERKEKAPPVTVAEGEEHEGQLLLYAQDFQRLLELERGQRTLLQNAYRETVVALARALESKDDSTGAHSERVRRYATELARRVDAALLEEPGLEYGFILHDVGKIGIPDRVLRKPGTLSESERRLMQTHTILGEQMVGGAALLRGEGARVVRSHHERWDGTGYPDRLKGEEIPLGARIFSIADSLDAITSDRPYRGARTWEEALDEIAAKAGAQFDPELVDVFTRHEPALRAVYSEFNLEGPGFAKAS